MPVTETLPPGTYYIGDIGYALSTEIFLDYWGYQHNYVPGSFHISDGQFVVDKTANGDGIFYGSDGSKYLVDAGNIGIVTRNLWDKTIEHLRSLGKIVDVTHSLHVYFSNGTFHFFDEGKSFFISTR